ncbi:MAG TPA: PQQ-binding-like beta-propeller repeat protein [Thermoguttaceae bacterium]|nr:PQQ-binding-like beta-propeller repeat protein [Thermoguttaceae bacterium]
MNERRAFAVGLFRMVLTMTAVCWAAVVCAAQPSAVGSNARAALKKIGVTKGICAVVGLPTGVQADFVTDLAQGSELLVYFQSPVAEEVAAVREAAEAAGLLGQRVFVDQGNGNSIQLADNVADVVLVSQAAYDGPAPNEFLRVLHPEGKAILGDVQIVKPQPEGTDDWSHLYHGPDNNPLSTDRLARVPYLTQFLAGPKFCPMPEVTVAAGGRIFKAFGHIAHKANQNAMLNTMLCINGYNGTILWRRDVPEGFMIHRSTMIATPETLYFGDAESCKLIDARTGRVKDEIVLPEGLADGPVWKWMALEDGVLYALVGGEEIEVALQPSSTPGMGHWPWGMWQGHEYADPKTNFGFGRTFVAIDPASKKILWSHREEEYIDSRGVCMKNGRICFYSPEKFLGCLDAKEGAVAWKTSDAELLRAIGPNGRAQLYVTGYATQTYIKCDDRHLFFAGPQRSRLVVVSAEDGKLLWQKEHGNLQLVLRDDAIYAAGPGDTGSKMDYATGRQLAVLPTRRACTRATGSIDSIFYRTSGGTVRLDVASGAAHHVAPMRPPCQDGVIISDGLLYWGPWMCGCQLSLYGHVGLASAGGFDFHPAVDDSRLETGYDGPLGPELAVRPGDWPCYQGDNARTAVAKVEIPRRVKRYWTFQPSTPCRPTAPVTAGGVVFVGDESGVVRALGIASGLEHWKGYTDGSVFLPPAVADGRVFVGSADGRVYAFEAGTPGRMLWSFRAAPAEQRIPVFDKLISRWPVGGGVVVQDGVVYAAAGIVNYDGTYVYALDAATGKVKWYNDTSGTVSQARNSGVSLQGELQIRDGELRFAAGNVHDVARYDLATGKCLNAPNQSVQSSFRTAYYPYYPRYGKYLSFAHTYDDGKTLGYMASYDGVQHSRLTLLAPLSAGAAAPPRPTDRVTDRPADRQPGPQRKVLWQEQTGRVYNSFILGGDVLLTAGRTGPQDAAESFLAAMDVKTGEDVWYQKLPAGVVKGGTAVDADGHIVVSLEDGRVICFAAGE